MEEYKKKHNEQYYQLIAEYSEDYIQRYLAVQELNDFDELERIGISDISSIVRETAIQRIKQLYPNKAKKLLSENNTPELINAYYKLLEHTKREILRRKQKREYDETLKRIQKKVGSTYIPIRKHGLTNIKASNF